MYNEFPPHVCPLTLKICTESKCISVTTVKDGQAKECLNLCEKCGPDFVQQMDQPSQVLPPEVPTTVSIEIDPASTTGDQLITIITSAEQLLDVFTGKGLPVEPLPPPKAPCPKCGLTIEGFNKVGRFGCAHCYTHYLDEFLAVAGPFQNGADEHLGKRPKPKESLEDQIKLVKLKIAHAIEMEKYEDVRPLQEELDRLIKSSETQSS